MTGFFGAGLALVARRGALAEARLAEAWRAEARLAMAGLAMAGLAMAGLVLAGLAMAPPPRAQQATMAATRTGGFI